MKMRTVLGVTALVLGLAFIWYFSSLPIPPLEKPLTDRISFLPEAAATEVRRICGELQQETTAELVVLIMDSTGGEDHHDFALRAFNTWGIGRADLNNGLLLFFAMRDRRVEILPGIRYEGFFTGPACTDLLNAHTVPLMRAGKGQEGVVVTTREVAARIRAFEERTKAGVEPTTAGPAEAPPAASVSTPLPPHRIPMSKFSRKLNDAVTFGRRLWDDAAASFRNLREGTQEFLVVLGRVIAHLLQKVATSNPTHPLRLLLVTLFAAWALLTWLFFRMTLKYGRLLLPRWLAVILIFAGGVGLIWFVGKHLNLGSNILDQLISGMTGLLLVFFLALARHICPKCHRWLDIINQVLCPATTSSTGSGRMTYHCESCGYDYSYSYSIAMRSEASERGSHRSSSGSSHRGSSSGGRSSGGGGGASW